MKKKSKPNSAVAKVVERIAAKTRGKKVAVTQSQSQLTDAIRNFGLTASEPPVFPLHKHEFTQCSNAISQLTKDYHGHSRSLNLPSTLLPFVV